jgi:hypothetical protein
MDRKFQVSRARGGTEEALYEYAHGMAVRTGGYYRLKVGGTANSAFHHNGIELARTRRIPLPLSAA